MKIYGLLLCFACSMVAMEPGPITERVWPRVAINTSDGIAYLNPPAAQALDSAYCARIVFNGQKVKTIPVVDVSSWPVDRECIGLIGRLACASGEERLDMLSSMPLERMRMLVAVLELLRSDALYDEVACVLTRRLVSESAADATKVQAECAALACRSDAVAALVTNMLHEQPRIIPAALLPDDNRCVPDLSADGTRIVTFNNSQLNITELRTGNVLLADATCRTGVNEDSTVYFCEGEKRVLVCKSSSITLYDAATGCSIKHIDIGGAIVSLNRQKTSFVVLHAGGVAMYSAHNARRMSGFECRHYVDENNRGTWSADGAYWTYVPNPITPKDERVYGQPIVLGDDASHQVHCLAEGKAALSADGRFAAYTQLAPLGVVAGARYPGVCVYDIKKKRAQFFPRLMGPSLTPDGHILVARGLNTKGVATCVKIISLQDDWPPRTIEGDAETYGWRVWLTADGKRLVALAVGRYDQNMLHVLDMRTGDRIGEAIACRWAEVSQTSGRVAVIIDADDGAHCKQARELGSSMIAALGPAQGARLKILDAYSGRSVGVVHRLCLRVVPLPVFNSAGTLLAFHADYPGRCLLFDASVGEYLGKIACDAAHEASGSCASVAGDDAPDEHKISLERLVCPRLYDVACVTGLCGQLRPTVHHVSGMSAGGDRVERLIQMVRDWRLSSPAAVPTPETA